MVTAGTVTGNLWEFSGPTSLGGTFINFAKMLYDCQVKECWQESIVILMPMGPHISEASPGPVS